MRQILIDHARSRLAEHRRMREVERDLNARPFENAADLARLLEVDSAWTSWKNIPRAWPRWCCTATSPATARRETADLLDVHVRTVTRDWHKARAWLLMALDRNGSGAAPSDPDA